MLAKAKLTEIKAFTSASNQAEVVPESQGGVSVDVQFNPETLKVSLANNNKGGNQPGGGSGRQFVGAGTSTFQVEFVFDTTADGKDVRRKTEKVARFVMAKEQSGDRNNRRTPPRCRFEWGSFIFEGVVDSMDETLDYFSEEGVPLRATVSLKMSRDDIAFLFGDARPPAPITPGAPGSAGTAGQAPLDTARPGDNVQDLAARAGRSADWKAIAAANNIDDPLRLSAGALVNVGAGLSAGAAVGASASAGAGVGAAASAGVSAGGGAAVGFSAGLGGGVGFSAGAGGSAGFGGGASGGLGAGASVGGGVSAGGSIGGGISAGAAVSGGISAGTGIGLQAGVGVKAGVGAQAGAKLSFG